MAIMKTKMEPSRRQLSAKLDKAMRLLTEVMKAMREDNADISPALYRKLVSRWKAIEHGKTALHHYKSLEHFDKSVA